MVSPSSCQYLNELIAEMRQMSEMGVEWKHARILLSREISRVFDDIQKKPFSPLAPPSPQFVATPLSKNARVIHPFLTPSPVSVANSSPFFPNSSSSSSSSANPSPLMMSSRHPLSFSTPSPYSPHSSSSGGNNPFVTPVKYGKRDDGDWKLDTPLSAALPPTPNAVTPNSDDFVLQTKIYIPEPPTKLAGRSVKCNYVGRILGPSGTSARMIERQFGVTLLIRGAGSVRDAETEASLKGRKGYEHLAEPLHVLLVARNADRQKCVETLDKAAAKVESLLTPVHDKYKNEQLVRLAVMNGTYKERHVTRRDTPPGQMDEGVVKMTTTSEGREQEVN